MRRLLRRVVLGGLAATLVYLGVTFYQVWRAARTAAARPAQAIVVLGAAEYNGRPSAVLRARLDHAAQLYRKGIAPTVVVTGGKQPGDRFTEATASANYLHGRGVPDTAILRETTGRSSWESLAATALILEQRRMRRVVLVSDPFHSERVRLIARQLGLDAVTSPTHTSPIHGLREWERFGGETLRVAVGRVLGFGRLTRATRTLGSILP